MRQPPARILPTLTAATAVLVATCGATAALADPGLPHRSMQARFTTPARYRHDARPTRAVSYDPGAVPVGGWVRVTQSVNRWGGMNVGLQVRGLRPGERYRAELHVGSCGARPGEAGRAFQNGPSRNDYSANEFWLNFTTNGAGGASVLTRKYWGIGMHQHARSVVIHAPGSRSAEAACVTVPFRRIWGW